MADLYRDLYDEVATLRQELAAMRPVVEAAKAWRCMRTSTPTKPKPESAALIAAVDVLYGAQPCICRPIHRDDDPICQYRPALDGGGQ